MHKKFIISTLSITTGFYLLYSYFVLNHKMLYMDREYPMWLYTKNMATTKSNKKYNLLAVGDSRLKAGFIPVNNNLTSSLNLSLGGGTPIEGYYTLSKYLLNNPAPNHLVLSYVPGHLLSFSNYWKRTIPFDFITAKEHDEIMNRALQYNESALLSKTREYADYKYPNTYASNFKNGIVGARWLINDSVLKKIQLSNGHYFFGTNDFANGLSGDAFRKEFKPLPLQTYYFIELIKLAKKNKIKLHFYYMPYNQSTFEKLAPNFVKQFKSFIETISKKHNMKICNDFFYMSNDKFGDPSHLYHGAKENTEMVYQCIV
jgi:hypothetical protein